MTSEPGGRQIVAENTEIFRTPSNKGAIGSVSQGPDTTSDASDMIDTTAWSHRNNSNTDSEYGFNFGSQIVAEGALENFTPDMSSLDVLGSDSNLDFQPESCNMATDGSQMATHDPEVGMLFGNGSECSCFSRAIGIHEAIEVNLVSVLQDQAGTAEYFLQQLKTCLADCEALLMCESCRYRSAYVMLILSMCEKLASCLESAWLVMPSGGRGARMDRTTRQDVSSSLESVQPQTPRSGGRRENAALLQLDYDAEPARPRRGRQPGQEDEFERPNARRRLEIGPWKLDDDDEIHVFYGLLMARVGMFGTLLTTLEILVTSQNWPVHKSVSMDLQERYTDVFTMVKGTFKGNALNLL